MSKYRIHSGPVFETHCITHVQTMWKCAKLLTWLLTQAENKAMSQRMCQNKNSEIVARYDAGCRY